MPLAAYTAGIDLKVNNYYNNGRAEAGVVYAYDQTNTLLGKDSGYTMGTNLQAGIDRGFKPSQANRYYYHQTNQGIFTKITNVAAGVSDPAAAIVTANVAFVNATFEEATEKEVYLAGNVDTHIDSKKVNAGDILTYFITYTNYTGENVVADITDVIPQYTSYVEGSADNGGVFKNGAVTWKLENVEAWESVTVTFKVTVNADVGAVTIENQATATDGTLTYKSNLVKNHTVQPPVPPTDSDNPLTGDTATLSLWIAMLIISGGGFIITAAYGRKKEFGEA